MAGKAARQVRGFSVFPSIFVAILRMIKFEHSLFALPLAFAGMLLAVPAWPSLTKAGLVLTAMVGARSAAMAFNRLADADFDRDNARTARREIPQGIVKKWHAAVFTLVSSILFLVSTYLLNPLCFQLAPIVLALVLFYSLSKRFTAWCHLILGLALGLSPVGGWVAITGSLSWKPFLLTIAVLLWVGGFDVLYACMDLDFDRKAGLKSIPAYFGANKSLLFARGFHVGAWIFFIVTGLALNLSIAYYVSMVIVGGLLVLEHIIISPNDFTRINTAFFTVNSFVSVVLFFGIFLNKFIYV